MGFEPTTLRDLAGCSTTELLGLCAHSEVGFPYLRIETPLLNYLMITHIMNDLHDGVCMRNIPYVK